MRRFALLPVLLTLAACASAPPPPPASRTVSSPAPVVRERVERAMRGLGLTPDEAPGGLRASFHAGTGEHWSACPRKLVYDYQSQNVRSDWASPHGRRGAVTVGFAPSDDGTRVTVSTQVAATYTNRFFNTAETGPCRSTGRLEAQLLDAAAG